MVRLLLILLAVCTPATAAVLYVDPAASCPGSGTMEAPYCRTNGPAGALTAATCGTTVRLKATAPYPAVLVRGKRCTPTTPLVLENDLYQEPVITGDVAIDDSSSVVVRGLTLLGGSLKVKTRQTAVSDVHLLGNRLLGPAGPEAIELTGSWIQGLPIVGAVIRNNLVQDFSGTAIKLTLTQSARVTHNRLLRGSCVRHEVEGKPQGQVVGIKLSTGSVTTAVMGAWGDVISDNTLADFEETDACRMRLALPLATVHGIYCDVGPSDGLISRNLLQRLAPQSPGQVWGIRLEARCNRWLVTENVIEDSGGGALRVNGPNTDVAFVGNTVWRPKSWCVVVDEGFAPLGPLARPGIRRRVVGNLCQSPGIEALRMSHESRMEDPQFTEEGNSWNDHTRQRR